VARNQIKNNNSKVTYEYINSPGKDTFRQFPYHIKLMQTIEISKDQAIFTLEIDNLDDKIIPFAP
jgi:galactose mutarotase-like enzyme